MGKTLREVFDTSTDSTSLLLREEVSMDLSTHHVDWFLRTIRPLLIDHFVHGFKHGAEYAREKER